MNRLTKGRGLIGKFLPDSIVRVDKVLTGTGDVTLTIDQCKTNFLKLGTAPGGPFNVIFSHEIQNYYVIWNASGYTATLKCHSGATVTIADGGMGIYYSNGVGMYALTGSTGTTVTLDGVQTLTNKTLTAPVIATIAQNATGSQIMTLPNTASDTLVGLAATQTLTNKTLDGFVRGTPVADLDFGATATVTLSAATKLATVLNATGATGAAVIVGPSESRLYHVINACTGTLTIKKTAGTGVTFAAGVNGIVIYNGTDYIKLVTSA